MVVDSSQCEHPQCVDERFDRPKWSTDNRWSPGSSGAEVPTDAVAVYSARWIDQGDGQPADIVHDRQGTAYNSLRDRELLYERLGRVRPAEVVGQINLPRDVPFHLCDDGRLHVWARRAGGYVYVDAWIPA